ncbi:MAG: hypothetical protein JRG71_16730, partial [Deltaproteobacteria bacterium]|nr:hypothetical protein [Deltaproteobacteria bacterium]
MNKLQRQILCSKIAMVLIFAIVLIGFWLIIVQQANFQSFEQHVNQQIENATAKKNLGELIVGDLGEISTRFHMILISAVGDHQKQLLSETNQIFDQLFHILDIL